MIRTLIRKLRAKREAGTATAALIARRAQRTATSARRLAAAYERKHTILARGK